MLTHPIKRMAVYCGSNFGTDKRFRQAAESLGQYIAKNGIELVYGGGNVGLMGTVADAVLQNGGQVIGVIPTFLKDKEMAHTGIQTLIEVPDMMVRKVKMMELADAFIALPGGLGTFEEFFEAFSAAQLRLHKKPIGFLNCVDFYKPLQHLLQQTIDMGFMPASNLSLCHFEPDVERLMAAMLAHNPNYTPKHVDAQIQGI